MELVIFILALFELVLIVIWSRIQFKLFNSQEMLIESLEKLLIVSENKVEKQKQLRLEEQRNNELILKENAKLKARIVDLENNVEFLYNNLSAKNKALIEGNKKRKKEH